MEDKCVFYLFHFTGSVVDDKCVFVYFTVQVAEWMISVFVCISLYR